MFRSRLAQGSTVLPKGKGFPVLLLPSQGVFMPVGRLCLASRLSVQAEGPVAGRLKKKAATVARWEVVC